MEPPTPIVAEPSPPLVVPRQKQYNALNLAFSRKNKLNSSAQTIKASRRENFIDNMIRKRELKTIVPGLLTVSTYDKFPPLAYEVPTGRRDAEGNEIMRWEGLDVDFIREFAKFIGYKVRFVKETVFKGIWDKPRMGESDLAISGIANSFGPDGPRGGDGTEWTLPYFYVNRSIIKKKTTAFPGAHLTIAATEGSTGWNDGKARGVNAMGKLIKAEGDKVNFQKLYRDEIKAIMHGDDVSRALIRENVAKYLAANPGNQKLEKYPLTMVSWEMVPTLLPKDGEIFAYPTKAGSGVAVVLSAFIIRSIQNGLLESLVHKYHMDLDHFIDERSIPTGEYIPSEKGYTEDRDLSAKLVAFLNKESRILYFLDAINKSLQDLYKNDKIVNRFAPQFKNLAVCDPYLLNFYIIQMFEPNKENQTKLAMLINGDPFNNNSPSEAKQLQKNEFSNTIIKFGSLRQEKPFKYAYNPNTQQHILTIDCSIFLKQIRKELQEAATFEEKREIYENHAILLAKQCIAHVFYHQMARNLTLESLRKIMPGENIIPLWESFSSNNISTFITPEDIYTVLFIEYQKELNKHLKEEEEREKLKANKDVFYKNKTRKQSTKPPSTANNSYSNNYFPV